MPSWDWESPDWVEGTFERDTRDSERWMRLDDEEERERDLIDRLRERGSSLSGRATRQAGLTPAGSRPGESARPESDEREAA